MRVGLLRRRPDDLMAACAAFILVLGDQRHPQQGLLLGHPAQIQPCRLGYDRLVTRRATLLGDTRRFVAHQHELKSIVHFHPDGPHAPLARRRDEARQLTVQRHTSLDDRAVNRDADVGRLDDTGIGQPRKLRNSEAVLDRSTGVCQGMSINEYVLFDTRGPRHGPRILATHPLAVKEKDQLNACFQGRTGPVQRASKFMRIHSSGPVPRLVLASTSPYRRQLLERFGLSFTVAAPNVDESPLPGETPIDLANRLARTKADVIARRHPGSIVVGSDQMAALGREMIGKPGSPERCIEQLRLLSGQRLTFHTAVNVIHSDTGSNESHMDVTIVHFRKLADQEIQRYVARERPFNCAGGFKAEGLGITLFERIESNDPTGLIGLPLIWLAGALRRAGFSLP